MMVGDSINVSLDCIEARFICYLFLALFQCLNPNKSDSIILSIFCTFSAILTVELQVPVLPFSNSLWCEGVIMELKLTLESPRKIRKSYVYSVRTLVCQNVQ